MRVAVVLFTRDLRVHDNPALAAAVAEAESVLPLFVLDDGSADALRCAAGRRALLAGSLADLDASLRRLGAALDVRRGEVVDETVRAAREGERRPCSRPPTSARTHRARAGARGRDRSAARRRQLRRSRRGRSRRGRRPLPGLLAVPPRLVAGAVGAPVAGAPGDRLPDGVEPGAPERSSWIQRRVPRRRERGRRARAGVAPQAARRLRQGGHDELAADTTSRLSPYLHFGCVSPRALAVRARELGGDAFVRQLCWRDFYAQLLAARPGTQVEDMRARGDRWRDDPDGLAAWKEGLTGYPIVDAGMRQLRAEGWMHNRARMITASFLVKDLWSTGASARATSSTCWSTATWPRTRQLAVGRRHRHRHPAEPRLQPDRSTEEARPGWGYVRRYVPELDDVPGRNLAEPGLLAPSYPRPIVDHASAVEAFRRAP